MRRGVVVVVVVRGRLEGVSGGANSSLNTPSSSSEAETSESEKATLRFFVVPLPLPLPLLLLLLGASDEGVVLLALRRADLVGEADRECGCECEGVPPPPALLLVGVFDDDAASAVFELLLLAFFLRMSRTVTRMDSFRSTQSPSIVFTRRQKTLSEMPCLSTSDVYCTVESWP